MTVAYLLLLLQLLYSFWLESHQITAEQHARTSSEMLRRGDNDTIPLSLNIQACHESDNFKNYIVPLPSSLIIKRVFIMTVIRYY